jgi:hypothetical protein
MGQHNLTKRKETVRQLSLRPHAHLRLQQLLCGALHSAPCTQL